MTTQTSAFHLPNFCILQIIPVEPHPIQLYRPDTEAAALRASGKHVQAIAFRQRQRYVIESRGSIAYLSVPRITA